MRFLFLPTPFKDGDVVFLSAPRLEVDAGLEPVLLEGLQNHTFGIDLCRKRRRIKGGKICLPNSLSRSITVQRKFIKDLLRRRITSMGPTCKWLNIKHSIDPVAHVLHVFSTDVSEVNLSQRGLICTVTENKVAPLRYKVASNNMHSKRKNVTVTAI